MTTDNPPLFYAFDKTTGNEIKGPDIIYIDRDGTVYKDCDPCGLDMSGKRRIIGTDKIEIRWNK